VRAILYIFSPSSCIYRVGMRTRSPILIVSHETPPNRYTGGSGRLCVCDIIVTQNAPIVSGGSCCTHRLPTLLVRIQPLSHNAPLVSGGLGYEVSHCHTTPQPLHRWFRLCAWHHCHTTPQPLAVEIHRPPKAVCYRAFINQEREKGDRR
jgi:hypothetical protein